MFWLSLFLYSSFLNSTLSSLSPEETYLTSAALLGLQNIPQKLQESPPTPAAGSPLAVAVPGLNSVNLCPGGDSEKPRFPDRPGHRRRRCFYRSMLNPDTASWECHQVWFLWLLIVLLLPWSSWGWSSRCSRFSRSSVPPLPGQFPDGSFQDHSPWAAPALWPQSASDNSFDCFPSWPGRGIAPAV